MPPRGLLKGIFHLAQLNSPGDVLSRGICYLSYMKLLAITSTTLLFSFIIFGVVRFGLLPSYSSYASKWGKVWGLPIWSVVTLLSAALIMPVLIEVMSPMFQFLGFLTPLYLIGVSLTPTWETDPVVRKWHVILAGLCAAFGVAWLVFTMNIWLLVVPIVVSLVGVFTWSWKNNYVFWLEMIMFSSVYATALFLLFA